jgi:hypothetical protein
MKRYELEVRPPEAAKRSGVWEYVADVKKQRAKFDRNDPAVNGKAARGNEDASDEALRQPPNTPPPGD